MNTEAEELLLAGRFSDCLSLGSDDARTSFVKVLATLDPSVTEDFESRCRLVSSAADGFVKNNPEMKAWIISLLDRFVGFLKEKNAFYEYEYMVVENIYLDQSRSMISGNYIYARMRELRHSIAETPLQEDVDMRSVSRIYLELCDIVYCDYNEACKKEFNSPSEENLHQIHRCLALIRDLVIHGVDALSLRSSMSPSAYRQWINKLEYKCRSASEFVSYSGKDGILESLLKEFSDAVSSILSDPELDALQELRNRTYLEENAKMIEWGNNALIQLNIQLEACDPYDLTQRHYLTQLINTTTDWLNGFHKDR